MQKEPGFLTLEWRAPIHVTLKGKLKVEMKAFESPIWSHSAKKNHDVGIQQNVFAFLESVTTVLCLNRPALLCCTHLCLKQSAQT